MKFPKQEILGELFCVGTTIIVCGLIVAFGGGYGRVALDAIYSDQEFPFDFVTHIARTAAIWSPALYGFLFFTVIIIRLKFLGSHWITWAALCIAAIAAALTLYGIVKPFATTTFSMGTQ